MIWERGGEICQLPASVETFQLSACIFWQEFNSYGDRSFQVAAEELFNKLPMELKTAVSTNSFEAQLKTYLINL